MRDWIYRFARCGPKRLSDSTLLRNNSAVDISFGTVGFTRVLARPFVRVSFLYESKILCLFCLLHACMHVLQSMWLFQPHAFLLRRLYYQVACCTLRACTHWPLPTQKCEVYILILVGEY